MLTYEYNKVILAFQRAGFTIDAAIADAVADIIGNPVPSERAAALHALLETLGVIS